MLFYTGDPKRIRTADCAVRGRRLNHLTMGPFDFCPCILPQDLVRRKHFEEML